MPVTAAQQLLPATDVSASGTSDVLYGFQKWGGVAGVLRVTAAPAGGAPTLDCYVQGSADGGTTWRDVAAYRFTGIAARQFSVSQIASGGTATLAASDAALTSDTAVQGPFGDRLRLKYVFAAGGSTGAFTLAADVCPVAGP